MFIGHWATGFAGKRFAVPVSLGTLFFAAQFTDLLWPVLVLTGIEQVAVDPGNTAFTPLHFIDYPFSHSLLAALFWGALIALIHFSFRKDRRGAMVIAALVIGHWLLDLVSHGPDLQLVPWSEIRVGMGLWYNIVLTVIVEGAVFAAGLYIYLISTKAKDRTGSVALWSLVALLVLIYIMNLVGPPPETGTQVAAAGFAQWLIVGWGAWIDRHREAAI